MHHVHHLPLLFEYRIALGARLYRICATVISLEYLPLVYVQAESAYRVALEHYSNSPRLVRLYGRFLETIKQNPWGAAE